MNNDIEIGKTYSDEKLEDMGYEFRIISVENTLAGELMITKQHTKQYKVLDVGNDQYKIIKEISTENNGQRCHNKIQKGGKMITKYNFWDYAMILCFFVGTFFLGFYVRDIKVEQQKKQINEQQEIIKQQEYTIDQLTEELWEYNQLIPIE